VDVADGDGEGVACVFGGGRFLQRKNLCNHTLNLLFRRGTMAHDSLFNLARRVLVDVQVGLGTSEENHAAYLAELECRGDVFAVERAFNGHFLGFEARDELLQSVVDEDIPFR